MARSRLDAPSRRVKLPKGEVHWLRLDQGLALGYRRDANGKGTWYTRRALGNGRYSKKALGLADDAHRSGAGGALSYAQAIEAARKWARERVGHAGPATVGEVFDIYLEAYQRRNTTDHRLKITRAELDHAASHKVGARPLRSFAVTDLKQEYIEGWLRARVEDVSAQTVRRHWSTVRAALNHGWRTGQISDRAAWERIRLDTGRGNARQVFLTDDQVQRLIAVAPDPLSLIIAAGATTGCRLGELRKAKVEDFDASLGTLTVDGKTGPRTIHLAPQALEVLKRAQA